MLKLLFLLVIIFFSIFSFVPVFAQFDMLGTEYGGYSGLGNQDPRFVVARMLGWAMGLLGVGALGIFIYSGFEWMTALGNDQKVASAKKRILYTVIGMGILLSAYAITMFVFKTVYLSTNARLY